MGFLWLLPFFLLRFGLLSLLDRNAVKRAAYFAPMPEQERWAYWLYQLSNTAILVCMLFARIRPAPTRLFAAGLAVYAAGLALLAASVAAFARPDESGINRKGLYRLSRNPMYAAYFVYFTGCALLARSPLLAVLVLIFQTSAHRIILAEERWCVQTFGAAYLQYMGMVRRYF